MMMCNGPLALAARSPADGAGEESGLRCATVEARCAGERRTTAAPDSGCGVTAGRLSTLSQKASAGAPEAPIRMKAAPAARIRRVERTAPNPRPLQRDLAAKGGPYVHNRLEALSFRNEKRFTRQEPFGRTRKIAPHRQRRLATEVPRRCDQPALNRASMSACEAWPGSSSSLGPCRRAGWRWRSAMAAAA